jgi:hypothetical protein
MRLTETLRSAFVRAALQDVPNDHKILEAEAHKLVIQDSVDQLPKQLVFATADPKLSVCLNRTHHWFRNSPFSSVYVFAPERTDYIMSEATAKKVAVLSEKARATRQTIEDLQEKLESVAKSCTTRKQLAELLPEFEKYLPDNAPAASRAVPAIANLVTEFTKAGWPKEKATA